MKPLIKLKIRKSNLFVDHQKILIEKKRNKILHVYIFSPFNLIIDRNYLIN